MTLKSIEEKLGLLEKRISLIEARSSANSNSVTPKVIPGIPVEQNEYIWQEGKWVKLEKWFTNPFGIRQSSWWR